MMEGERKIYLSTLVERRRVRPVDPWVAERRARGAIVNDVREISSLEERHVEAHV